MWNAPTKARLAKIPALYSTEEVPTKDKIIHLHFFIGGSDWYAAEFDGEDLFFGYAILNGDHQNAEWGYFSLRELKSIRIGGMEIDCELAAYFKPKKVSDIPNISQSA